MRCDECNIDIVKQNEALECPNCGLVHGLIMEENTFKDGELVRHSDVKYLGGFFSKERGASKLRRLARIHSVPSNERTINRGLRYCNMVASEFSMSASATEEMKRYYVLLIKKGIFSARMPLEIRAAAIGYIVLKQYDYSYTLQEMSKVLELPAKKISKLSRGFARELGLSYIFSNVNVGSLLEKFCLRLGKSRLFINECINIHEYINSLESKHPTSAYLAGLIYFTETTQLEKSITQKMIAEVLGVSVVTIRTRHNKILKLLNIKNTYGLTINDIIAGVR
tara:strand:+ start:1219 stop:2061 length:843 start_codon:yes stop_codon:yes gene_type:complete